MSESTKTAAGVITSVCVYCGSREGDNPAWRAAAEALGTGLAARGMTLVFGGGRIGLMGAVADAAVAGGGKVIGIIPEDLETREVGHQSVAELHVVSNMHERKMLMAQKSDAFVVLPGGLGTLDETFEIVTWRQLRFHDKPVVIADIEGFWTPLRALVDNAIDRGFAAARDRTLMTWATTVPEIFAALEAAPPPDTAFQPEKV